MNVFVTEDSAHIRKRLVALLRTVPQVVVVGEADSPQGALAAALDSACDVLLLDLQLANGSGLEILPQLRRQRPSLRVIVLTNLATAQHRAASLAAGADVFLDKSVEFLRVPKILRECIGAAPSGFSDHAT